jgi:hypothetical protein
MGALMPAPKAKKPKPRKRRALARAPRPSSAKTRAPRPDNEEVYEDVYQQLTAIMDAAPQGPGVELAVLDAVIAAAAHYAADCFNEADAAAGALKCVQLFSERMRETLVAVSDADDGDQHLVGRPMRPLLP